MQKSAAGPQVKLLTAGQLANDKAPMRKGLPGQLNIHIFDASRPAHSRGLLMQELGVENGIAVVDAITLASNK